MTLWSDNLENIYESDIAVTATLLVPSSGGAEFSVRLIDKTSGIEISDQQGLQTIRSAAVLRMSTLEDNSILRTDLDNGTVTINSKDWKIQSHLLKPNPDGELKGEVVLLLIDESVQ